MDDLKPWQQEMVFESYLKLSELEADLKKKRHWLTEAVKYYYLRTYRISNRF